VQRTAGLKGVWSSEMLGLLIPVMEGWEYPAPHTQTHTHTHIPDAPSQPTTAAARHRPVRVREKERERGWYREKMKREKYSRPKPMFSASHEVTKKLIASFIKGELRSILTFQTKTSKISVAYTVFLKFAPCWLQWGKL